MQAAPDIDYKQLYEQSQLRLISLEQQLAQLKKMIFGSRSERFLPAVTNPAQLSLDIHTPALASVTVTAEKEITYTKKTIAAEKPSVHPGRMTLPPHLRRETILIEPMQDTSACRRMGEEITEVLEYEPGELYVKQYVRPKYALPDGEGVLIGQLPARPIDKLLAGEGLLAQVVIDKYVDHLPLYRQMQRFDRGGLKLPYSTLTDWVSATCHLIEPLFEALKKEVLATGYLHADETPIKVLDKDKKGTTHRGFFWVYYCSRQKQVLFDYREGRGREGPKDMLKDFTGYLQTDGYAVYDDFDGRDGIVLLHCMAHTRRKFTEALDNDHDRASHVLQEMQRLYEIEGRARSESQDHDKIYRLRQEEAVPILKDLENWMKEEYTQVLPKSLIGQALAYALQRWEKLSLYTTDGKLLIDNNAVENAIRPVAIGRKNYLFCGSHEAARRSAMLYSLLGTCKLQGVEPYQWLKNTITRIAHHPISKINLLLPGRTEG